MKKGLLICVGGYSTSLIAQKLNESSKDVIEFKEIAYGGGLNDWKVEVDNSNIVLISPQAKHLSKEIKEVCDKNGISIFEIPRALYSPLKTPNIWNEIKGLIK